jgi:hypothetical protein
MKYSKINITVWDATPCNTETTRSFGGIHRFHPRVEGQAMPRNQQKQMTSSTCERKSLNLLSVSAGFLLGLILDLED